MSHTHTHTFIHTHTQDGKVELALTAISYLGGDGKIELALNAISYLGEDGKNDQECFTSQVIRNSMIGLVEFLENSTKPVIQKVCLELAGWPGAAGAELRWAGLGWAELG